MTRGGGGIIAGDGDPEGEKQTASCGDDAGVVDEGRDGARARRRGRDGEAEGAGSPHASRRAACVSLASGRSAFIAFSTWLKLNRDS